MSAEEPAYSTIRSRPIDHARCATFSATLTSILTCDRIDRVKKGRTRMDFSIQPLDLVRPVVGSTPSIDKNSSVQGSGFKEAMLKALQATSDLQTESGRLSKEFSLDNPTVSLEQTMIAGVKSSIAFQATLQVRNRVVQAYTDTMNMQV